MFYIERLERKAGGPHPAFYWRPLYYCPVRWPLELFLRHLDQQKYKITERNSRP